VEQTQVMPFFEVLPPPPPEPTSGGPTGWRPPVWDRPSEALLGASISASLLLAKTDRLAVVFDDVHVYPNGFTFALGIVGNPMVARDAMGHGPMGFGPRLHQRGPRIGFEFSDGTRAQISGPPVPPGGGSSQMLVATANADSDVRRNPWGVLVDADGAPVEPVLMMRGGGGGSDRFDQRFWCYPLPPAGPMSIYLEWTDVGIDERAAVFDAHLIREAVARVITIWPTDT
jgi:hypothetical protein